MVGSRQIDAWESSSSKSLTAVDSLISAPSVSSWPLTMCWAAPTSSVPERVRPSQPPQASTCWWTSLTTPARCTAVPWGAQRRRRCWDARWGASLRFKKKKKKDISRSNIFLVHSFFQSLAFYLDIGNLKIIWPLTFKTCCAWGVLIYDYIWLGMHRKGRQLHVTHFPMRVAC